MRRTGVTADKPTVVAVGLFIPGNSFTRVFESLFDKLSASFTIHWLGIAYKGEKKSEKNYTLHPCNITGGDMYGAYGAAALATEFAAAAILLINDFYLLKNYEPAWKPLKENGTRLLAYVPLDGEITDISIVQDSFFLDELVLYNQWALDEVTHAVEKYRNREPVTTTPRLSFIYHGVDRKAFHPLGDDREKSLLKQKLFPAGEAAESIFILNANRYNERKDLATTLKAFAKAVPLFERPAYLCLHTPNLKPGQEEELETLITESGCRERIFLNPMGNEYVDDCRLVKLFQACAIGINTSLGEGWGMISFEHAACGAAQLVPGHTAQPELWEGAGIIIGKKRAAKLSTNPFQMYQVNEDDAAAGLVKLVNEEKYLAAVSARCYEHATGKRYSWEQVSGRWKKILG
ncbi:MAG: glycosyltransferase [Chitinophagaceae bacterium]